MTQNSDNKPPSPNAKKRDTRLNEKWLGDKLRKVYTDVVDEPLPDEFADLLAQLDDVTKGESPSQ